MSKQDGRGRRVSAPGEDDPRATMLHVDMDAFFVEVAILDNPALRGLPVIVGGTGPRSVVSSASYEARRFGVTSAMPVARARQLCPQLIIAPVEYGRFQEESAKVMAIFERFTPLVEPLSIDEAFLDVSGARRIWGTPAQIGHLLRETVRAETGLPCSVGVAANKFIAKVASGMAKPDGLLLVPHDEGERFLRPLPIRALWGVGGKTAEILEGRGIRTIADVADTPEPVLARAVGVASAARLTQLAHGHDPRVIETRSAEKSIGHETTFTIDETDPEAVRRVVLSLSEQVAARLRRAGMSARTIAVKVRFEDFRTITRSRSLLEATDLAHRIDAEAMALVEPAVAGRPVRLLGVRAEQLVEGGSGEQAVLWDPDEEWRSTETTVDALRARFGNAAISRATLLGPRGDRRRGSGGSSQRAPDRTEH